MKIKYAIIAAIILAAASITSLKTIKSSNSLLDANAEVLAYFEGMPGEQERTCFYHSSSYDPSLYLEVISCETCETVKTSSTYNPDTCILLGNN